jgi:hypothetical protein
MKNDLQNKVMSFKEKSNIFNNIIHFTGFRTKILAVGYDSIESDSHVCDIQIELTEECPISGAKAPYPVISLDCGHNISVIALSGLVNIQASDYTESVRCPHCRANLMPKMIEKKPDFTAVPDPSIVSTIFKSGMSRRNSVSEVDVPEYTQKKIISSENINTVMENMGLREKKIYEDVIEEEEENESNSSMPLLEPIEPLVDWSVANRAWDEADEWGVRNRDERDLPLPELPAVRDVDEMSFAGNLSSQVASEDEMEEEAETEVQVLVTETVPEAVEDETETEVQVLVTEEEPEAEPEAEPETETEVQVLVTEEEPETEPEAAHSSEVEVTDIEAAVTETVDSESEPEAEPETTNTTENKTQSECVIH